MKSRRDPTHPALHVSSALASASTGVSADPHDVQFSLEPQFLFSSFDSCEASQVSLVGGRAHTKSV